MPRRRWAGTVRARVTAGSTLILAIAAVVAALIAAGLLRRALETDVETTLHERVDQVADLIGSDQLTVILQPTGEDTAQVQVIDAAGNVVSVSPSLAVTTRLDVVAAPALGRERSTTVDGDRIGGKPGDDYRVLARTVASPGGPLTVYAATSLVAATNAESHLRRGMLVGLPIVVGLAAWLIWWVVGRAFAPVDAMRATVDRIEATDLSGRVELGPGDSEIAHLGATLNRMLDRLHEAAARQELFAASASHELRSPLSAIRTELEVGLAYPDRADWPSIAEDSLVEVARLESLARDLGTLTRSLAATPDASQRCDLWAVVGEEVARRRPGPGVAYHATGEAAEVDVDRSRLLQVVRNLFDNAERHAAAAITVEVCDAPAGVVLRVANDGEPVPAEMREQIFEPFVRLDEARSLDAGGSGLGLAIARAIVTDVGGTLTAPDVADGAEFRATFPHPPRER